MPRLPLLCLMVLTAAACHKRDEPPPPPPAVKTVDAAVVHGVPNTAVASAPRKDWPCRLVTRLDGGNMILSRPTYGARASCWLPADFAGSRAIVGCPDEKLDQNVANKLDLREEYRYDDTGHLTEIHTIAGVVHYQWDGDLLVSRTTPGHPPATYTAAGSGADITEQDGVREHVELAGGHVVRYQDDTTFVWKGTRLVGIQGLGDTRVDYDCTKPID